VPASENCFLSDPLDEESVEAVASETSEIDFNAVTDGRAVKKDDLVVKNGQAPKVGPVPRNGSSDKDSPAVKDGKA
jgi:hypothetical protein